MPYLKIEKDVGITAKNLDEDKIKYTVTGNTIEIRLEDVADWSGLNIRIGEGFDADNYNISIKRKIPTWLFIFPDFIFNNLQNFFDLILCIRFTEEGKKEV